MAAATVVCFLMLSGTWATQKVGAYDNDPPAPAQGIDVYDGFEAPTPSKIWRTTKLAPGAFTIQSAIVRAGRSAAQITIHEGDNAGPGDSASATSERDELQEAPELEAIEDRSYMYAFSMYIPDDFPIVTTRLVIAQWKQRCPRDPCAPDNPVVALRYSGGELFVSHQVGSERTTLYRTADDVKHRWLDFRFHIRFSRTPAGRVKAWLNGKVIIDYTGINAYTQGGYPPQSRFYFKMGLYRDRMAAPMTIFIDEYRKRQISADAF